jgi:hypothetical protein
MLNILALQDLPSLNLLELVADPDGGKDTCTACSYTCTHTLSE